MHFEHGCKCLHLQLKMNLLFNDIDELRKHISFLYATAEFYSLRSDLLLATEDLILVVGEYIFRGSFTWRDIFLPKYNFMIKS